VTPRFLRARTLVGLGCAFAVLVVGRAIGLSEPASVLGYATSLFIWTMMTSEEAK